MSISTPGSWRVLDTYCWLHNLPELLSLVELDSCYLWLPSTCILEISHIMSFIYWRIFSPFKKDFSPPLKKLNSKPRFPYNLGQACEQAFLHRDTHPVDVVVKACGSCGVQLQVSYTLGEGAAVCLLLQGWWLSSGGAWFSGPLKISVTGLI